MNTRFTGRVPLILGWLGGFVLQAALRSQIQGTPFVAALLPVTGMAFLLFTFYMVTDPATTPSAPLRQFAFGGGGGRGLRPADAACTWSSACSSRSWWSARSEDWDWRCWPSVRSPVRSHGRAADAGSGVDRTLAGAGSGGMNVATDRPGRARLCLSRCPLAGRAVGERAGGPPRVPPPAAGAAPRRGLLVGGPRRRRSDLCGRRRR